MRSSRTDVDIKDINWRMMGYLIPYLVEYKGRIALALTCLVGAKLASVGLPFILKHIVDGLDQADEKVQAIAIPLGLLIAYGLVRFSNVLFGELRDSIFGRVTERAMRRVGLSVFQHLHSLDLEFHLNRRTGGLSRDIERGNAGISFLMRFMVFHIVPTLLEILLVIGLLWKNYSVWFALIIFLAIAAYILFSVFATEWRTKYVRQANIAESASSTRSVDSLLNFETVKYFTNEAHEAEHYDKELEKWETARRKNRLSLFALNAGQAFIIAASMTSAMILAASEVTKQSMSLGDFVLINAFMMQIFLPLNFLGFVYREMKGSMANIEKMFALQAEQPQVTDKAGAEDIQVNKGEIVFDSVSFSYDQNRSILNGISFTVAANSKVAIVGSSGGGKSTLLKLLFRFYDYNSGHIYIDGQEINQVTQQSLRQSIGVVPQDTVLFNTSIYENVRYGRVSASRDEVLKAIELANLSDFIQRLPEGVDTLVGERGLKLSGGEKQRVGIARAILKQAPIMIFDEATSSLDSKSEKSILEAIREISKEQTSLVIAHRLSTILDADKIIVLHDGEMVEQGNHNELLALNKRYAQMWRIQLEES